MLVMFHTFIRVDSIMYNLTQEDESQALVLINKVYHPSEDRDDILQTLKGQVHRKEKTATFWSDIFGPDNL